jgi:hypothetical protein
MPAENDLGADFTSMRSFRRIPSVALAHRSSADLAASASVPLLPILDDPSASVPLGALPTLPELPASPGSKCSSNAAAALSGSSALQPLARVVSSGASSYVPVGNDDSDALGLDGLHLGDAVSSLGLGDSALDGSLVTSRQQSLEAKAAHSAAHDHTAADAPKVGPPVLSLVRAGMPSGGTAASMCPVLVPTGAITVARRWLSSKQVSVLEAGELLTDTVCVVPSAAGIEGDTAAQKGEVVSLQAVAAENGAVQVVACTQGLCRPLDVAVLKSFKVRRLWPQS